jgi:hypothetical protein
MAAAAVVVVIKNFRLLSLLPGFIGKVCSGRQDNRPAHVTQALAA